MRVLGIETSCDETAAAIVEEHRGVLANVVYSQVKIHSRFGGVVPEVASRAHIQSIGPVVAETLERASLRADQLDGVAVTAGPGLVGALLVGLAVAKGMAMALRVPLIGIHHMEGHLVSPFLEPDDRDPLQYPFVALLASGGHTLLVHALAFGLYEVLGQTRDDAVGEAFDKGAKLLGMNYPGGPAISALATRGDPQAVLFPRILLDRKAHDFSFSGLKTSLRNQLAKEPLELEPQRRADIAASYQEAIVETLAVKAIGACLAVSCPRLMVAGGVGANRRLRELLGEMAAEAGVRIHFPDPSLCTDNGAMIALAGLLRLKAGEWSPLDQLDARPRWPLGELPTPALG